MTNENASAKTTAETATAENKPGLMRRAGAAFGRFLLKPYIIYPAVGAGAFYAGYKAANYMAAKAAAAPTETPTETPTA